MRAQPEKPSSVKLLRALFIALIFCAVTARAEPIYPNPSTNAPSQTTDESQPAQSTVPLQPMDVGQPRGDFTTHADSYFYPYSRSISFNVGPYAYSQDGGIQTNGLLGFTYLWDSTTSVHFETGAETVGIGEGHVWTMLRWQRGVSVRWRPFYGAGLGVRIMPLRGLATFLQLQDYFPRVSGGLEVGIKGPHSVRAELAAACDLQGGAFATFTLGYVLGL